MLDPTIGFLLEVGTLNRRMYQGLTVASAYSVLGFPESGEYWSRNNRIQADDWPSCIIVVSNSSLILGCDKSTDSLILTTAVSKDVQWMHLLFVLTLWQMFTLLPLSKSGPLWWKFYLCKVGFFILFTLLGLTLSVILQIQLYALYNRSRKILFVMVPSFIIQLVAVVVSDIRASIFNHR